MDDVNKQFSMTLASMVSRIQQLNQLLLNDKHLFIANDLQKINESNDKKNLLLSELSLRLNELNELIPVSSDGKKPSLNEYISQLDKITAADAKRVLDDLYASLSAGYNHLVTNNHVVIANLGFINSIWDGILKVAGQHHDVYTKPELK